MPGYLVPGSGRRDVWHLGLPGRVSSIQDLGLRVHGRGFRVSGLGFRGLGLGVEVQDISGFRV